MLVDIHAHLDHEYYKDKLDQVISRAKKAGVTHIITSGVNTESNKINLEISKKYDIVKFSPGMYPIDLLGKQTHETGLSRQYTKINITEEFKFIKKNIKDIISIGEVGLDFKIDTTQHKQQINNFQEIINFVEKIKKPIIIHSRKAEKEVIDILETSKIKKINLHCFGGKKNLVKKAADLGYTFSIPCIINKLQHFQMIVDMVNLSQLLTETDAPWLSPIPEEMNEPQNIKQTIPIIAKIKRLDPEEVKKNIFMNFQKMFLK